MYSRVVSLFVFAEVFFSSLHFGLVDVRKNLIFIGVRLSFRHSKCILDFFYAQKNNYFQPNYVSCIDPRAIVDLCLIVIGWLSIECVARIKSIEYFECE